MRAGSAPGPIPDQTRSHVPTNRPNRCSFSASRGSGPETCSASGRPCGSGASMFHPLLDRVVRTVRRCLKEQSGAAAFTVVHRPGRRSSVRRVRRGEPMPTYKVGYFVGSLSSSSINRELAKALIKLAPDDLEFEEIAIRDLPLYSPDFDADYPPEAVALKDGIKRSQAVLFVTPEYNRSIPGALKNAIDWASRPWGQNSFDHIPAAVIGASIGQIGTAVAQQSLRGVLSFCNARQMTAPEAYIHYSPEVFRDDGEVTVESTAMFLSAFMNEFRDHIQRVLTVLPRSVDAVDAG